MGINTAFFLAGLMALGIAGEAQQLNDVVISEIMSDPTPSAGLPEVEYIELYNRTDRSISLKGWSLMMGARSTTFPDSVIGPRSYALACHRNNVAGMASYGKVIGLMNFLLPNEAATLSLFNPAGGLSYSVSYLINWWPAAQRNGGYALEMVDLNNPCLEQDNWEVSIDPKGGTPGNINSVRRSIADNLPLVIDKVEVTSDQELAVAFNKRLDSLGAVAGASIELTGRQIVRKLLDSPAFRVLRLTLDAPLIENQSYHLNIKNLADCGGNLLRDATTIVGIPVDADSGDVVINELLFNPRADGVDFVEIYNRSQRFISLRGWSLANVKDGIIDTQKTVSNQNDILPPFSFLALTTDPEKVKKQYPLSQDGRFLVVPSMPSFVNEKGGVVLLNSGGDVQDRFMYSEKMHHLLIDDPKGVSLERIDASKPASDASNWQSSAFLNGYATPGYANSQQIRMESYEDFIVSPEVITPNQDSVDDLAEIRFTQNLSGRIASARVFDVSGRLVKPIFENLLIGTQGKVVWDGTDRTGRVVKTGYYLIMIETFDLSGRKKQFRKKVVVVNE